MKKEKSFFNEYFQDIYKSKIGAIGEAKKKFVIPCKISKLAKNGEIKILDVCFGIGYNSLIAIHEALKVNPKCKITIVGLENDQAVFEQILKMKFDKKYKKEYSLIQKAVKKELKGQISIKLIEGDARITINDVKGLFDAVFLDPFTPKINPDMWSEKFISDISKKMKKHSIISTHLSAEFIKNNLKKAGLDVFDDPSNGKFANSTYAIK